MSARPDLAELTVKVALLEQDVRVLDTAKVDHEERIRVGETFGNRLFGYAAAGSILGGAIVAGLTLLSRFL